MYMLFRTGKLCYDNRQIPKSQGIKYEGFIPYSRKVQVRKLNVVYIKCILHQIENKETRKPSTISQP